MYMVSLNHDYASESYTPILTLAPPRRAQWHEHGLSGKRHVLDDVTMILGY